MSPLLQHVQEVCHVSDSVFFFCLNKKNEPYKKNPEFFSSLHFLLFKRISSRKFVYLNTKNFPNVHKSYNRNQANNPTEKVLVDLVKKQQPENQNP